MKGKLYRSGFKFFRDGLNILEILEVSLLDSPICDTRLVFN